jgi:hypothetical protein
MTTARLFDRPMSEADVLDAARRTVQSPTALRHAIEALSAVMAACEKVAPTIQRSTEKGHL